MVNDPVPITQDDSGMIRIDGTRVTLQTLVYAFRQGDSPEQIVESYPVLRLADVYTVIAYYLNRRDEVDAYVREQEKLADTIRQENELRFPSDGLRAKLLARMEAKTGKQS
ncbi:MAG: DUF433 domain-containing protein [Chloroflexota bacterium]